MSININPLVPMTRRCSNFFVFFYYFSVNHVYTTKTLVPFWCMQLICLKQCVALKLHWQVALKQNIIKPFCSLPIDPEINILMYLVCVLFPEN